MARKHDRPVPRVSGDYMNGKERIQFTEFGQQFLRHEAANLVSWRNLT